MKITSLSNQKIKNTVLLRSHRKRNETGLSIVEGIKEVTLAIDSRIKFNEIFICEELFPSSAAKNILTKIRSLEVPVFQTTKDVFSKISYGDREEGILGIFEKPKIELKDLKRKKSPFYLIVESLEKPGNLGAILRTCDAASVDGVIVCDERTDIYNPNVIRASIGAIFTVNTLVSSNKNTLQFLKENDIKIFAALPKAKEAYTKCDFTKSSAIVFGSEQEGLSDFWKDKADKGIVIPMKGKMDSLNVSVSSAVIVYEAMRQRETRKK